MPFHFARLQIKRSLPGKCMYRQFLAFDIQGQCAWRKGYGVTQNCPVNLVITHRVEFDHRWTDGKLWIEYHTRNFQA